MTAKAPERPTDSAIIEQLVADAAAGRGDAADRLMRKYWHIIERLVRHRRRRLGTQLRLREATCDLSQDAAIRVLRELPKHGWRGKSAFIAWIRAVASAQMIDEARYHGAQKRNRAVETVADEPNLAAQSARSLESQLDEKDHLRSLSNEIARLKPEYHDALLLCALGGTHEEIGEYLDCSGEAARKLVSRARAALTRVRRGPRGHGDQK